MPIQAGDKHFSSYFFLIGRVLSKFRQKMDGLMPLELDIELFFPALTSYLLAKRDYLKNPWLENINVYKSNFKSWTK